MSVTSISAMPAGRDQLGQVLGHGADEADLDVAEVLGPGRCQGVPVVGLHADVGGDVLPPGPAEGLVVASYCAITRFTRSSYPWSNSWLPTDETSRPGLVERVDRRLVLRDERLERRGADQVTGGREHRVGVLAPQLLDRTGQHRGAGRRRGRVVLQIDRGSRWCPGSGCHGVRRLRRVLKPTISGLWSEDAERVRRVEVGDVVVEPAVLVVDRLVGVDRPRCRRP